MGWSLRRGKMSASPIPGPEALAGAAPDPGRIGGRGAKPAKGRAALVGALVIVRIGARLKNEHDDQTDGEHCGEKGQPAGGRPKPGSCGLLRVDGTDSSGALERGGARLFSAPSGIS